MTQSLILISLMAFIAFWPADQGQVSANVTAVGYASEMNLSSSAAATDHELKIKRSDFPVDFFFGVATSAGQTEGSAAVGGRGPSVWDHRFKTVPRAVRDHEKFSMAIDGYKRYREDIQHLKDLGINSYRLSISWSRVLPTGSLSGGVNQEAVDHYNTLINELISNGIKPFFTIYHFDMPQALEEKYGGLISRSFVDDFTDYSELCFQLFGDRVKHWLTINEPNVLAQYGYETGISPPGRCSLPNDTCALKSDTTGQCFIPAGPCDFGGNSSIEPYIAAHNLILAHATAAKVYHEKYQAQQQGQIGIVLASQYFVPHSKSKEDKSAAKRLFDFYLGWFMDPFLHGEYPSSMRISVKERLPRFTEEEKLILKGSLDFVGLNYYTSTYAVHKPPTDHEALRYTFDSWADTIGIKEGEILGVSHGHWPEGLEKLLKYVKKEYKNPKVYITENGIIDRSNIDTFPLEVRLEDRDRISFIARHLYRVSKAIKKGVNVKGYFYWAAFDDFEWGAGLGQRFGLYYIDYSADYKRIPKRSASWYHGFLQ